MINDREHVGRRHRRDAASNNDGTAPRRQRRIPIPILSHLDFIYLIPSPTLNPPQNNTSRRKAPHLATKGFVSSICPPDNQALRTLANPEPPPRSPIMPLVVPGVTTSSSTTGNPKTDEWTNKLVGKKLHDEDSNETVRPAFTPALRCGKGAFN